MLNLDERCLDRWLGDFNEFKYDFLYCSQAIAKSVGLYFEFDQGKLKVAHESWVAACHKWESSLVMPNSKGLSHLKIVSILLVQLCSVEWVKEVIHYDRNSPDQCFFFQGTPEEEKEIREDIAAARGAFFGFQFAIQILNWFESGRDDRVQPFVYRMTEDLEHDLMVFLTSELRSEMATFLIFKALYARDQKI